MGDLAQTKSFEHSILMGEERVTSPTGMPCDLSKRQIAVFSFHDYHLGLSIRPVKPRYVPETDIGSR